MIETAAYRHRRSEVYWREQVLSWRKSGLKQSDYARREGINPRALSRWKLKIDSEQTSAASSMIVQVPAELLAEPMPVSAETCPPAGLRLRIGLYCLEVPSDFSATVLALLLDVLESRQ